MLEQQKQQTKKLGNPRNGTHTTPIVFFGTEDFSAQSLGALINAGFCIELVVAKPDSKKGRGQKISIPAVKQIAQKHEIKVLQPKNIIEIIEPIGRLNNPAGVLVSYGKIIPQKIIDLFSPGIINVHPSLLPKYRGPSPIESAILNGDSQTGVSIMQLTANMDAGPVYSQKLINLTGNENRLDMYKSLSKIGATELVKILDNIMANNLLPKPQDNSNATYCQLLKKSDSYLSPSSMSAQEMDRHIRAYQGYPRSRLVLYGHEIIVTKASVTETVSEIVPQVMGKDGTYLSIEKLIGPSGKTMTGEDFMRGYTKN